MKYLWMFATLVFLIMGGYYWVFKGQVDYGALYIALASFNYGGYLSDSKKDKDA